MLAHYHALPKYFLKSALTTLNKTSILIKSLLFITFFFPRLWQASFLLVGQGGIELNKFLVKYVVHLRLKHKQSKYCPSSSVSRHRYTRQYLFFSGSPLTTADEASCQQSMPKYHLTMQNSFHLLWHSIEQGCHLSSCMALQKQPHRAVEKYRAPERRNTLEDFNA